MPIVIVSVAWAALPIILLVLYVRLRKRVDSLQSAIHDLRAGSTPLGQAAAPRPAPAPQAATGDIAGPWARKAPPESGVGNDAGTTEADDVMPPPVPPTPAEALSEAEPPRAYVFREGRAGELVVWLRDHWVLVAGAASLVLAGLFLVQYGVEKGLLTPFWRIMAALALGACFLAGGEALRRRFGDEDDTPFEYLPSVLAGAGILTLFVAILAARALYGLIGAGPAFTGMFAVAVVAMVFGWFYGPVLAALGIVGATAVPFLVGGSSEAAWLVHYYFVLIAVAGLAVDSLKRWAWVSAVVLIATLAAAWLLHLEVDAPQHFLAAILLIGAAAVIIPERRPVPLHGGTSVLGFIARKLGYFDTGGPVSYPEFPTRLAVGVTAFAALQSVLVGLGAGPADGYLGLLGIAILLAATLVWMSRAPALTDLPLFPAAALVVTAVAQVRLDGGLYTAFLAALTREPETAPPAIVWTLVGLAMIGSLMAFWRMTRSSPEDEGNGLDLRVYWALIAAVLAPLVLLILEFLWDPSLVHGAYAWALAVIAVAGVMTLLAERTGRQPDFARRLLCVSLFGIAAATLIGLALFLLLTKTALTLALALMVLLIIAVDRRFDLPVLGVFALVGTAIITYRLVFDPGMDWAEDPQTVPLVEVLLAYLGPMALLGYAWQMCRAPRPRVGLVIESTVWMLFAVFVMVMLLRQLPGQDFDNHWTVGLFATIWTASALVQLYRMAGAGTFERRLRIVLACVFSLPAGLFLLASLMLVNPLTTFGEQVVGPPVFNSLFVAYVPLALVLAFGAMKLSHIRALVRLALGTLAALIAAWYVFLGIRHSWRGADLTVPGVTDPELYTYTLAMLVGSGGLLLVAFWRRIVWARQLAMAGVALTIGKVFFIDMSGLSGLIRVVSFLGLGLALLGLTWLNRVMAAQWDRVDPERPTPPPE